MFAPDNYETLPMHWVGDYAGRRAAITPRRCAIFDAATGKRYSYAEMNERAKRVGTYLTKTLGLGKGDVVAYLGRNRLEAIDLYLACGKTGIVLAPWSYRLSQRELNDLLTRIQPKAFFYDAEFADQLEGLGAGLHRIALADDGGDYDAVLATPAEDCNRELSESDPFLYIHTGGTTQTPKVCVVPHRQMLWNSFEIMASSGDNLGGRRELLTFPLFHIAGWNTLTPVYHAGGHIVLMRRMDPGRVLELIASEKITAFGGVEAMLQAIVDHPDFAQADLSSLRAVVNGGAPCVPRALRPFWERGVAVCQSYGLTEGGPSNFAYIPDDDDRAAVWARHDSIGHSLFHCDYKIVHPETHDKVPQGEVGVLCLRSAHNFNGYLHDAERSERVFLPGGWVYSGDLAREDEDGYVYIIGRSDNVFISGGVNISPEEIESVLTEHPEVAQVAVVGINDPQWGQAPLALVVPQDGAAPTEDSLLAYCEQQLSRHKLPRRILIRAELPMTSAGKIDRGALRKQFP